jgi:FtsH-binding integral membrane protein
MFVGHFALGLAAKRATPRVSLATLFAAAQLADLLWPFLLAAGVEQVRIDPGNTAFTPLDFVSYPYSHSLVMLIVWGVALGYGYTTLRRQNGRTFAVLAALVVSHWVLDVVTHRPDMPIYPGGPRFGLELWRSVPATIAVESAMFAAAVWIYARATRPRDRIGRWSLVGMVALLVVSYLAAAFGPPPPSVAAISIVGIIGGAITLVLAWWVDAHRRSA